MKNRWNSLMLVGVLALVSSGAEAACKTVFVREGNVAQLELAAALEEKGYALSTKLMDADYTAHLSADRLEQDASWNHFFGEVRWSTTLVVSDIKTGDPVFISSMEKYGIFRKKNRKADALRLIESLKKQIPHACDSTES